MSSGRTKVIIALLLTGFIPLTVFCAILYPLVFGGHRERVERGLETYADTQLQRVEDLLIYRARDETVVSGSNSSKKKKILRFDPDEWLRLTRSDSTLGLSGQTLIAKLQPDGTVGYLIPEGGDETDRINDKHGNDLMKQALSRVLLGDSGVFEGIDSAGIPVLVASRSVPKANIAVLVRLDEKEAFAEANRLRTIAFIAPFAALFLTATVAVLLARWPILIQTADERTELLENQIAESQAAQRALAESEERFALAIAGSNEGIWDWNVQTGEIYFSPRFKELLGFEPNEFENSFTAWESRLHPQDKESTVRALKTHLEEGTLYDVEYRLRCKDSTFKWFRARGLAVHDDVGEATRMAGSITDITTRKSAEAELLRSNEELEQFAYIASHDLQEPIRTVSSYVQLFSRRFKGQLGDDADEYLGFILEGSDRMRQLIQGLLLYARVGSRTKEFELVDTGKVLEDTLKNLELAIEESGGAEITHDELPQIHADPVQITQLFQNLISNAVKFRSDKPLKIHISVKKHDSDWRFTVRDNGIGIDPKHQERVFLIFQRLHARDKYPGTGIGLSVCKRIVSRHGGSIWVDSHPDSGATFGFTLPIAGVETNSDEVEDETPDEVVSRDDSDSDSDSEPPSASPPSSPSSENPPAKPSPQVRPLSQPAPAAKVAATATSG